MRPICCDKTHGKHGPWSEEEDAKMVAHVSKHGAGNWTSVPKKAGLRRCGKSCRLRWTNYLKPDLKHESFAAEEEDLIIKLHAAIGSRWSIIAQQLPGRSDNDVKNYWNTRLKKKLKEKGIDPITHRPFSHILRDYESIGGTSPGTRNITSTNRDIKNTFLPSTSGFPSPGLNSQNSLSKADVEPPQLGLGLLAQLQAIKLVTETSMECSFPSPPLPPSSSPSSSSSSSSAASSHSFSWSKFLLEDTVLQSDGSAAVQGETIVEPSTEDSIPAKNNVFQGGAHPGGSQACSSSPSSESSFVEAMLKRDREMYFMEFPELWEEPHY